MQKPSLNKPLCKQSKLPPECGWSDDVQETQWTLKRVFLATLSGLHGLLLERDTQKMCFLGNYMQDSSLNWSLLRFLRLISCLVSPTRHSFMWLLFENRLGVHRAWEKSNLKAVRGFRPLLKKCLTSYSSFFFCKGKANFCKFWQSTIPICSSLNCILWRAVIFFFYFGLFFSCLLSRMAVIFSLLFLVIKENK